MGALGGLMAGAMLAILKTTAFMDKVCSLGRITMVGANTLAPLYETSFMVKALWSWESPNTRGSSSMHCIMVRASSHGLIASENTVASGKKDRSLAWAP